jgi:hypothetical protein
MQVASLENRLEELGGLDYNSKEWGEGNNHYTESLFSTTKYRPGEPPRPFGSKGEACQGAEMVD